MRRKRHKRSRYPFRRSFKVIGIVAVCYAFAGCSYTATKVTPDNGTVNREQTAETAISVKPVKTAAVKRQKIAEPLVKAAEVQSSLQLDLIAKAPGDIAHVYKQRGDKVQAGETVVRLSSPEIDFQMELAALAARTSQEALGKAREAARREAENRKMELANSIQKLEQSLAEQTRNYNKIRNDYDVGRATKDQVHQMNVQLLASRTELDQMKQRQSMQAPQESFSELEAQLQNAQIALKQAEQSMSLLEIKAPVSGIVTEMAAESGMSLQPGTKIGQIQKIDPLKIKALLNEEESRLVSSKTELTYFLPGTHSARSKGKLSYVSKVIDPVAKGYEMNLDIGNPDMAMKPGMKVWIELTDEQDLMALTVPSYSLVKEGEEAYVFVVNGDRAEKRKVQLGRLNEPYQEIVLGVKEGERVVTSGMSQLKDNDAVKASAEDE